MTDTEAAEFGRCIAALLAAGKMLYLKDSMVFADQLGWIHGTSPADAVAKAALELGVSW